MNSSYLPSYEDGTETLAYTWPFIMFSAITNIYNKKTKGPTLMEVFTATGKLKSFSLLTNRDVRCVHHGWHGTHRSSLFVNKKKTFSVFLWLWKLPLR